MWLNAWRLWSPTGELSRTDPKIPFAGFALLPRMGLPITVDDVRTIIFFGCRSADASSSSLWGPPPPPPHLAQLRHRLVEQLGQAGSSGRQLVRMLLSEALDSGWSELKERWAVVW